METSGKLLLGRMRAFLSCFGVTIYTCSCKRLRMFPLQPYRAFFSKHSNTWKLPLMEDSPRKLTSLWRKRLMRNISIYLPFTKGKFTSLHALTIVIHSSSWFPDYWFLDVHWCTYISHPFGCILISLQWFDIIAACFCAIFSHFIDHSSATCFCVIFSYLVDYLSWACYLFCFTATTLFILLGMFWLVTHLRVVSSWTILIFVL